MHRRLSLSPNKNKRRRRDLIFVAILLAYPVLQFVGTWLFVNVGSLMMAFQQNIRGETVWTFNNFAEVVRQMFRSDAATLQYGINGAWIAVLNSLGYGVVTIFISLPLSLLFAYFLQKKMPFANVLRVIFFLPNIIPIVALTMAYNIPMQPGGYMYEILDKMGLAWDIYGAWPSSQIMVYVYCIWAGLGYNVVLLSGAIGRIPKEIFESAQLDGAGYFTEFTKITIPLIWPTIVTLVVLGMTNVLTLYLQPYLLAAERGNVDTIAMQIFNSVGTYDLNAYGESAAKGLLFSVIWAPIVLLVRNRMSKKYADVDF
ncbi:MAG: sugar ABC transporter permease [Corallococcus sp.]|nr:sugar ABC transporter permease [Corallococcus sp.]MCM1359589.1 sugar ABC transporter permease [Corallococcus sp.]MCM1395181.1 sugar ABC transporter permease [Corallococcus sp.]